MWHTITVFSMPQARDPRTGEPCGRRTSNGYVTIGPAHREEASMRSEFETVRRAIDEGTALRLPWIEADAGVVFHVRPKSERSSRR